MKHKPPKHAEEIERDEKRRCLRCLGTMPVGRYTQACDRCEGKPWPCVPQLVVDDADRDELARRCDAEEAAAWELAKLKPNDLRRKLAAF